ncbi:hypothetical protein JCM3770_005728 [Rhodotorula araucariae]
MPVQRSADAKTRSRAGCLTCRGRHKKCDETRLDEHGGACRRCFSGSWECRWPPLKPLRSFVSGSRRAQEKAAREQGREQNDGDEPEQQLEHLEGASESDPHVLVAAAEHTLAYDPTTTLDIPLSSTAAAPSTFPAAFPTATNPYADLDVLAPPSSFSAFLAAPAELPSDLSHFFSSLDAEVGYWDSLQGPLSAAGSPTMYHGASTTPRAVAGVAEQPRREHDPEQTLFQNNSRAAPPSQTKSAQSDARVEEDARDVVDPIYNTFNDGFFRSLPKPVRAIVIEKVYNVVGTSDLSRHAAMAMVMLYRLRMHQQAQVDAADVAQTSAQHAKLLAQSDHYFQKALEHLQAPIPLEAKLVAVLDMQSYQFDQWGAAAANAILLLGEYFINEALGSQPTIDFSDMRDPKNVLLSAVAWSDCVRCICVPRRRTIFAFTGLPGEPSATTPEAVVSDVSAHSNSIDAHLGLPLGLLLCVAATANLGAEIDALPDEVVRVKAAAIENATREWKPAPPNIEDLADSAWYIDKLSTAEMWRHAVIIFLYQAVHRHGPLSRVIRDAMQQILQLGSRVLQQYCAPVGSVPVRTTHAADAAPAAMGTSSSSSAATGTAPAPAPAPASPPPQAEDYLSAPSMRAVPWFLAGTAAQLAADRALCRRGIAICGQQQGYRDNVAALERIWEVTDDKGWTVDWRALLQSEQRFVGWL